MRTLSEDEKGINILALDAGSPGAVIFQMYILAELMLRLRNELGKEEDLLPSDHFDLIGGSGIGAFAALCVGPLRMGGEEVIEALQLLGVSVFYENLDEERRTLFSSSDLRETVKSIIENSGNSSDAMIGTIAPKARSKAVFFVSPLTDNSSCHRLRSYQGRKGALQCTVLDVALACISTSGLFDPAEIGPRRSKYTSAGIHHSNPINNILDEAEQTFGGEKRVACIISLGSSVAPVTVTPSFNFSQINIQALFQAMEMQQTMITEEAEHQFGKLEAYYRFSAEGLGSGRLSDWTNWDAGSIEVCAHKYIQNPPYSTELDAAVGQLVSSRGTITLQRLNHPSGPAITAKSFPPVTQFFVLRKKPWAFIQKSLATAPLDRQTIFVLSGMAGSGKSTILSHYVQVYRAKYSHVFLIDASSAQTIKADLQNSIRSLGEEHSQKTWEEALQYLAQDRPDENWLVAFDNADDPSVPLEDFIPKSEHVTIFFTSRNRDLCSLTSSNLHWELGPMTEEEAIDVLIQSTQRPSSPSDQDIQDGTVLIERLGRLPLAIVQAGIYCFQHTLTIDGTKVPFTFGRYLDELDQNMKAIMQHDAAQSLDNYGKSVYAAFNTSYSALPPPTRDFLHICGFFHHSDIPLLMLESAVENRFQPRDMILEPDKDPVIEGRLAALLQLPGKVTTIRLHGFIFSLRAFSLVFTSTSSKSLMLNYHPLIHTWSRDVLSADDRRLYRAMATRVVSTCTEEELYRVHNLLTPHILEALKYSSELHLNDKAAFAEALSHGTMVAEAEALYRDMYDECARKFGEEHKYTLMVLHNLAISIKNQARFAEAAKIEEVVINRKSDNGDFFTRSNLATSYIQQERWSEADAILEKLSVEAKETYGEDHLWTLGVLHNKAASSLHQGRHRKAMELQEEILKVYRRTRGEDHLETLNCMSNLAGSYIALLRFEDAERLQKEVLESMTRVHGKDKPDTLGAMSNLAYTYKLRQKYSEAVILGEQALEARRRILGDAHPDTLRTIWVLAVTYFEMDNVPEGVRLQEELRKLEGGKGQFSAGLETILMQLGMI